MSNYIIWNPTQVILLSGQVGHTFEQLREIEKEAGLRYSDIVSTDDIQGMVTAVFTLADVALSFHKIG